MKISGNNIVFCGSRDIGHVMRGEENCCCSLRSIRSYSSAYDLLYNETTLTDDLDPDFLDYLRGFDDFEPFEYFCLNGENYICADRIDGTILGIGDLPGLLEEIRIEYRYFCDGE